MLTTGYSRKRLEREFAEADVESNVVKWKSNGNVPNADMLSDWVREGLITQATADASTEERTKQYDEIARRYKAAQRRRTTEQIAEHMAEARAAHGAGVRLVNVITGETFVT